MAYRPRHPSAVSRNMAAIRGRDTACEIALRRALHRLGIRYRLHHPGVPGKPDLVFPVVKVAVFVDGDFWHGRMLRQLSPSALRRRLRARGAFWLAKLRRNQERDRRQSAQLRRSGWSVLRIWESDIRTRPGFALTKVLRTLAQRGYALPAACLFSLKTAG